MRTKYLVFGVLFSVICLFACKPDGVTKGTKKSETQSKGNAVVKENIDYSSMRALALQTIEYRIKNEGNQSYSAIESNVWQYEFLFDAKTMNIPAPYEGHWIDFKEDLTYEYGFYDTVEGSGKYHYSFEKGTVIVVDNDESKKPDEWDVKLSGDSLVLVGKASFDSNSIQAKLYRQDNIPTR